MADEQSNLDSTRLQIFRNILSDYDAVATGIRTLSTQLLARSDAGAERILAQLRATEEKLQLDRESMWKWQVGDAKLATLLAELSRRARGQDPLEALSAYLNRVRRLLAPLSHALEASIERHHELPPQIANGSFLDAKNDNLERVAYEAAFGAVELASKPIRLMFDTTSRCNLRCLTCYQSASRDIIHYDLADTSLSALKEAVLSAHQIFIEAMGEPLLSRSAFELVAFAKASGAYVEAITNGMSSTRAWRAIPAVDLMMVSFDRGSKESFEVIRRNGQFDTVISGLRELAPEHRRKVCFNVVVCKQNIYTLEDLLRLGLELGVGHIHLQEMNTFLEWHDRMELEEADRAWLFERLADWRRLAAGGELSLICNLVPPTGGLTAPALDIAEAAERNIRAVKDVKVVLASTRKSLAQISRELDALLAEEPPAIFRAIAASLRRLAAETEPDSLASRNVLGEATDWIALRDHVEADKAAFPHCLSTYAHLIVNGDGTTRSCCKVQNRLSSISQDSFADIWNAETYRELRAAHAKQIAPRAACRNCRDPVRFHFLPEILRTLENHDIDISLIRKPDDFPVPATYAEDPLVQKLGSNAIHDRAGHTDSRGD